MHTPYCQLQSISDVTAPIFLISGVFTYSVVCTDCPNCFISNDQFNTSTLMKYLWMHLSKIIVAEKTLLPHHHHFIFHCHCCFKIIHYWHCYHHKIFHCYALITIIKTSSLLSFSQYHSPPIPLLLQKIGAKKIFLQVFAIEEAGLKTHYHQFIFISTVESLATITIVSTIKKIIPVIICQM